MLAAVAVGAMARCRTLRALSCRGPNSNQPEPCESRYFAFGYAFIAALAGLEIEAIGRNAIEHFLHSPPSTVL
jgi:hypothetical protein